VGALTVEPLRFESPVLERARFRFAPGQVVPRPGAVTVLMGANGSGKSTALRVAAGLLRPASGAVLVDGIDVSTRSAWQRAARIAFVPQRTLVAAPFTVREVVALGRVARPSDAARVERALDEVGLSDRADDAFAALSGGQQQRTAIARALAQLEPTGILLLDEAFAAIDPAETAQTVRLVRRVAGQGTTVLAAAHDLALACALADDAWVLRDGGTMAFGRADEVLTAERAPALLGVAVASASGHVGRVLAPDYRATMHGR
jgi:ABC-type cobalamin/Fe3+-siderophores transport system ATPase subunit